MLVWDPETGKSKGSKSSVQTENFQVDPSECKWIRMGKTGKNLEDNAYNLYLHDFEWWMLSNQSKVFKPFVWWCDTSALTLDFIIRMDSIFLIKAPQFS